MPSKAKGIEHPPNNATRHHFPLDRYEGIVRTDKQLYSSATEFLLTIRFAASTTAFRRQNIETVLEKAEKAAFGLEFSSGLPHRPDMEEIFLRAKGLRIPHNYFPAPATPFVLNLASLDPATASLSYDHCANGLRLAQLSGAPFYSVHAGFCLDPRPEELGQKLKARPQGSRDQYWSAFVAAVKKLGAEAERLGVDLLIENNVVAPFNAPPAGERPHLLCYEQHEINALIKECPCPRLGILIDTGHLKVSAITMGFDAEDCLAAVEKNVRAFHHSDNNGLEDTNEPLNNYYWMLPLLARFREAWHILEVHDLTVEQVLHQRALLQAAF